MKITEIHLQMITPEVYFFTPPCVSDAGWREVERFGTDRYIKEGSPDHLRLTVDRLRISQEIVTVLYDKGLSVTFIKDGSTVFMDFYELIEHPVLRIYQKTYIATNERTVYYHKENDLVTVVFTFDEVRTRLYRHLNQIKRLKKKLANQKITQ